MSPKRIAVLGSGFDHLIKARGPLLRELAAAGHEVVAYTPGGHEQGLRQLAEWGVEFRRLDFGKSSLNPLKDAGFLLRLRRELKALEPDVLLAFTIKAVIYGMMAGRLAGVPRRVAMITGLGYAFMEGREPRRLVARAAAETGYRQALRLADAIIFQNQDDRSLFQNRGLLPRPDRSTLVSGSGVDTDRFAFSPIPAGPPVVLMLGRLLRDKGVYEYLEAARRVKAARPEVRFVLAGGIDDNPAAVSRAELDGWIAEGLVEYAGEVSDVRPLLAACHLFVLPSYREGMPVATLEALSTGRAVVTTDAPGCRETVQEGVNGRLVPVRDAGVLANAIADMVSDASRLAEQGAASRALCERRFAARVVIAETVKQLLG